MARSFVIHACLILLTFCPGKGNRRKKIIDSYKRDSALQRRALDWDNSNIYKDGEDYDDYPNYDAAYNAWDYPYKDTMRRTWDDYKTTHKDLVHGTKELENSKFVEKSVSNGDFVLNMSPDNKWPKFDDILLAMGKRYDWKNDRWIKVKKKEEDIGTNNKNVNTSVQFHEKHRFIYRIVRLNRPKSKRNIILAVTAVR